MASQYPSLGAFLATLTSELFFGHAVLRHSSFELREPKSSKKGQEKDGIPRGDFQDFEGFYMIPCEISPYKSVREMHVEY